jgi:hypothetical protein
VDASGRHIRGMKIRFSIAISAILLAAATLLIFNDRLHARGPHQPMTACGFWGPMEAGMSCQ